jgi:hypothetical protein
LAAKASGRAPDALPRRRDEGALAFKPIRHAAPLAGREIATALPPL